MMLRQLKWEACDVQACKENRERIKETARQSAIKAEAKIDKDVRHIHRQEKEDWEAYIMQQDLDER